MQTKFSTIIRKVFLGEGDEEPKPKVTEKTDTPPIKPRVRNLYETNLADFMLTFKDHLVIGGMDDTEANKRSMELLEFMKQYKYVPFHDISFP